MSIYSKHQKSFFCYLCLILLLSCSKADYYLFDGTKGNLEDLEGKWIIVNYWADWCPPCIKEMPELTAFYGNNREEVNVFAYNFDGLEGHELQEQIMRFKVSVPSILTDPADLFGWNVPPSLPTTFIIDPKGNTKEMLVGPQTEASLNEVLNKYKKI